MKNTLKIFTRTSFCLMMFGIAPVAAFAQTTDTAVNAGMQSQPPVEAYTVASLKNRYPTDSIQSQESAGAALKDVQDTRDKIEVQFVTDQHACYPKFFTTSCLDKVSERRRLDLTEIRPIEVEANAYLRKAKVVERDRKLAEKAAQNETEAADRAKQGEQKSIVAREKQNSNDRSVVSKEEQRKKRAEETARKQADHAAREEQRQAREVEGAEQRAINEKKYDEKARQSEIRQKQVAEKKAQREQQRTAKALKEAQKTQNPTPDLAPTTP